MSLEMSWGVVDFRRESVPKSGGEGAATVKALSPKVCSLYQTGGKQSSRIRGTQGPG